MTNAQRRRRNWGALGYYLANAALTALNVYLAATFAIGALCVGVAAQMALSAAYIWRSATK